jgi:hypothetical protein
MFSRRLSILLALTTIVVASGLAWKSHRESSRRLAASSVQERDLEIFALLDRPIELPVGERTLEKFAAELSAAMGIPVTLDEDSMRPAGWWPIDKIYVETPLPKMAAAAHLTLAFEQPDIGWTVRGGEILITTPEKLKSLPPLVATYALPQPELAEQRSDARIWAELIRSVIEPDSWDDVGGKGHCEPAGGALVVAHQPQVHRQIRALLTALKAHDEPQRSWQPVVIWPNAGNQENERALARLARPASIDCREMRLADLMRFLAFEHDVPIVLATKKLDAAGVYPDTPLSLRIDRMTLGSLLCHLLRELELTYVVRDGLVQITTPEDAEERLMTVAYPVHDLVQLRPFEGGETWWRDYDSLVALIHATVAPNSWDDVGGPAPLEAICGWLIIPQTAEVHAQIERLLSDLRNTPGSEDTPLFSSRERRQFEERVFAALERPIAGSYAGTKLKDVCDDVASQLGVPVLIFSKKLAEAGVPADATITCEFPPAPAAIQLARILEPQELAIVVRGEALGITTPEDAEGSVFPRVYDVRPLIEPGVSLPGMSEGRCLLNLVESHVTPESWDLVGGAGAVDLFRGLLVVSQSLERHGELERFLGELRRATALRNNKPAAPPANSDPAQERVLAALDREITLDHDEAPLAEVIKSLARQLEIPACVDEKRLDETKNWAVYYTTCHLPLAAARVQLERLCDLFELEWEIRHDLLTFTARGSGRLYTRVYDVRPLVAERDGLFINDLASGRRATREGIDYALLWTVKSRVSPDDWSDFRGAGNVHCLGGTLIVTQSRRVHAELTQFLAQLSNATAHRFEIDPADSAAATWPDAVIASLLASETAGTPDAERIRELSDRVSPRCYDILFLRRELPALFPSRPIFPWKDYLPGEFEEYNVLIGLIEESLRQKPRGIHDRPTITAARNILISSQTAAGHRQLREVLSKLKGYVAAHPTPPQNAAALLDELAAWLELPR